MYNFLLSEKYRTMHHTSLQFFFILCLLILGATAVFLRLTTPHEPLIQYGFALGSIMSFGIYIFAAVFTASFSKDRQMLLQLSAQGQPRWRILLGQYIVSLLVGLVFALALLVMAALTGLLFFKHTAGEVLPFLRTLGLHTWVSFLLLIPLLAIGFSLQYLMQNVAMSVAAFFVITFFLPGGFGMAIGMNRVLDWFIFMTPYYQSWEFYSVEQFRDGNLWQLGYTIFSNVVFWLGIALLRFNKSEL